MACYMSGSPTPIKLRVRVPPSGRHAPGTNHMCESLPLLTLLITIFVSDGVEDPHFAITQLAQTTMRSEIGKLSLDATFLERDQLNANIVSSINTAAAAWGIACMRYEIRDIAPPPAVRAAMEMQAEAERRKRALILDSQGEQEAEINLAQGKKQAAVLASEAAMQETINRGLGEAQAIEAQASASANAVRMLVRLHHWAPQPCTSFCRPLIYLLDDTPFLPSLLDQSGERCRCGRRPSGVDIAGCGAVRRCLQGASILWEHCCGACQYW